MNYLITTNAIHIFALLLGFGQVTAQWSTCTRSCGGGTQTKKSCTFFGGKFCSTISKGCNDFPCVTGWGIWSPCTKTCGGGHRFKVERCGNSDMYKCPKNYEDCNTQACKAIKCPRGQVYRYGELSSCCKPSNEQCGVPKRVSRRVFSGEPSKLGQWPWAVVIVNRKKRITHCSGNLIHPKWVLSAAHCMVGYSESDVYAILGTRTIKKPDIGSQTTDILKFHPHKEYTDDNPTYDIGLLEIKKTAVINSNVKPVCLPSGDRPSIDQSCVAAGWGIADAQGLITDTPSDYLIHVGLRILPIDACKSALARYYETQYITEKHNLCAGRYEGDKDTCRGDSGGPVICQRCQTCGWYLAGTTVYGARYCGLENKPAIYMNIRNFQYWIEQKVPIKSSGFYVC
uniref:granzyme K-like n=1 Tax=Styela clava TaxID=7725 RepID=UPI001939D7DD|nr:granzyme K-like [Styela clava]